MCGTPPGTREELDRVSADEQALWDVLNHSTGPASGPLRSAGRRPSEINRMMSQAEQDAERATAAGQRLAQHLDHLVAQYAELASAPFWFVHGVGLPANQKALFDWATRARAMVGHRRRYDVRDPLRPLGEEPEAGSVRAPEWAQLMQRPGATWQPTW